MFSQEIFFFGENRRMVFCKDSSFEIRLPVLINIPQKKTQIKQIISTAETNIFLFENGKAIEYLKDEKPQKIQIKNINKISCGWEIEAILTKEGTAFGKGKHINDKNPNEFINISSLIEDPNDRVIEDLVSGRDAIYLLTSNHNAYGIGSNDVGQLTSDAPRFTEKPILMMKNVSKIFSGNSAKALIALNSNQELFACGDHINGQLGLGKFRLDQSGQVEKMSQIQNIPKGKIIDIQCGNLHSIMLIEDENGKRKLYSSGYWLTNGIRIAPNTPLFTELKSKLFRNDNILDFSVGSSHTLILTENGKLIGFGSNDNGELTDIFDQDLAKPTQLQLPHLSFNISYYHVYCGPFNSFLYCSFFQDSPLICFNYSKEKNFVIFHLKPKMEK